MEYYVNVPELDTAKKFEDSIAGLSGIDISRRLDILAAIDRLIEEENEAEASEAQLRDTDR